VSLMEERGFIDDREHESFRGHKSCTTCGHFGFAVLDQCQVLSCCHLRQALLTPGSHPLKSCKNRSYCSAVDPYSEGT